MWCFTEGLTIILSDWTYNNFIKRKKVSPTRYVLKEWHLIVWLSSAQAHGNTSFSLLAHGKALASDGCWKDSTCVGGAAEGVSALPVVSTALCWGTRWRHAGDRQDQSTAALFPWKEQLSLCSPLPKVGRLETSLVLGNSWYYYKTHDRNLLCGDKNVLFFSSLGKRGD